MTYYYGSGWYGGSYYGGSYGGSYGSSWYSGTKYSSTYTSKYCYTGNRASNDTGSVNDDSSVTLNILANDSLKTGVSGIIVGNNVLCRVGQTVTLDSGATVTLNKNGSLTYNTNSAFDLACNESTIDSFSYKIVDCYGKTSNLATVDVTVNSTSTGHTDIPSSLPETIGFTIVDENMPAGTSDAAFTMMLTSADARFDGLVVEAAYCIDTSQSYITDTALTGHIYLADPDHIPAGVMADDIMANLDVLNWILNQDFTTIDNGDGTGQTYTDAEVQGAIWGITNDRVFVANGGGTAANAREIMDLALANGEGFEAGAGDLVGLIVAGDTDAINQGHMQPFLIAVEYDSLIFC
ncbi:MAG: Ig-like domain-containing protein [Paracoccus sp. (in: a-proteobacteria)]|uniref:Ig-like domain-containing protein n=1 Tax=Paracoccus sp. TaxID=267 RepID=UPI0026E0D297|nr:Ig-like domain-containing protein [Paracoccus sp. (in: a-proteobacteria)]MDO5620847.1 Ig-like domain-containing protein [Paracoccus sp. (in: a-proteobacteria)]